jgi:hypothetical protein
MVRSRVLLSVCPILGAAVVFGFSPAAKAASSPVTFAQAIEDSSNADANVFAYSDNASTPSADAEFGTSDGKTIGASIPIDFTYLSGAGLLPADLTGLQDATISMTSSTITAASTAFGGTFADQKITGAGAIVDQIKITRDTPAAEGNGTKTNLLTVTFVGDLVGSVGGSTPVLNADSSVTGDSVTYSSDFLTFAQSTSEGFNLALSSWDPTAAPSTGLTVNNSDMNYTNATAAGAATFDFAGSVSSIPEPASLPTFVFAGAVMLIACGRQFRFGGRRNLASAI